MGVGESECGFPGVGMFGICCTPATLHPSPWGVLGGRAAPEQRRVAPPLSAAAEAKDVPEDACHLLQ